MRSVAAAFALAVATASLAACGTTTVDTSVTTTPAGPTTTMLAPIPDDATLDELLPLLEETLRSLDEQVVDNEGDEDTLARAEAIWARAEPLVREVRPELLVGFEQTMTLVRTAVERRRPADASKGYKLLVVVVDEVLANE